MSARRNKKYDINHSFAAIYTLESFKVGIYISLTRLSLKLHIYTNLISVIRGIIFTLINIPFHSFISSKFKKGKIQ
jgi:hypothetical protein